MTDSSRDQMFAKAYDLGFSDGFRAACDHCWSLGFDEGLKEAAIEST